MEVAWPEWKKKLDVGCYSQRIYGIVMSLYGYYGRDLKKGSLYFACGNCGVMMVMQIL